MRSVLAWLTALFALAGAHSPAAAQPQAPGADALLGLWGADLHYGPAFRGELTMRRQGRRWTATIAEARAAFEASGRELRFSLPDARGGFRGRLSRDGSEIRGFWLQPSGETEDRQDPGGSGQSFATPVALARAGSDLWRGTVVPLDDRFRLYLSIFRDQNGVLTAAFRNPELNANGGASRFQVLRDGDALWFNLRYDGGEINHAGQVLRAPDRIRLDWSDTGPIELTRLDPHMAAGFFPRLPGSPPYVYGRPPETGDGWRTAAAGEVGIDEAVLAQVVQSIIDNDPTARPPTLIHSLLIAYRGRLVLEEYFFGYDRETPHDIRSAGKTFSSVMLGAARMRGIALSPETRIYPLMARLGPFANPDPRKAEISLAHLMTHSAGLACNDNDDASPGNEGTMQRQTGQPDWWKYTLDLPQAFDPGRRYAYCSANTNLVGAALTEATRTWLPEFFARTVAEPLQFGRWHWNLMANGEGYLAGGAFLRPRDMLKVGQAYLDGGVWNGRRIVPAGWVAESTRSRIAINPQTTGYSEEDFGNYYGAGADGLAWHLGQLNVGGRNVPTYSASGNGGQVIFVIPDYELVAVFTGGNYRQGGIWGGWGQQIVGERIIPAIRR